MICRAKNLQGLLSKTQQNRVTYLLLGVIAIALGLRIWGIGFGLPYALTFDEDHEILRAFKLGAGEYDWQGWGKGGLYYLLFVEYSLIYVVWWMMGWVGNSHEFALLYFRDPSVFYLTGRLTVALMGTMTCLVIFLIGNRVYDWRVGLGAAFIGASAYFHGVWSHFINVDIGMTLALWASILAYLQYEEKRKLQWLVGAGALGGMAIAFKSPGAIVLPVLLLVIVSHAESWRSPRRLLKEVAIVLVTLLTTLSVMAPETTMNIASLHRSFSRVMEQGVEPNAPFEHSMRDAVDMVTIFRDKKWSGYVNILLQRDNFALTLSALLGAGLALLRKQRWGIILSVLIVIFVGSLMAADRSQTQHYLLPVMPALWLLSGAAIVAGLGRRPSLVLTGLTCIIAFPLMAVVYQDYMWTRPDTRAVAKEWIEANIPSGAKILADGMRYRFVQSPPLNPDKSTVDHRVAQASETRRLSRGISQQTLTLYAKAMNQVKGPTYRLHSTVWGLEVEDLDYYVLTCFDYIVTSSSNSDRYVGESSRQRFPKSARFYEQLTTDSRFQVIYSIASVPWKRNGPIITVYKVLHTCSESSKVPRSPSPIHAN
jgi:4-amino-4-deoxy-L-arabinose transferase-like glycosyltransferase